MKKQYTGHKDLLINKQTIVEHLRPVVDQECRFYTVDSLTDAQIAVVVSALRMHHTLVHASEYDYSELHEPGTKTDFYPIQSSIGRYFRDAAGDVLRHEQDMLTLRVAAVDERLHGKKKPVENAQEANTNLSEESETPKENT